MKTSTYSLVESLPRMPTPYHPCPYPHSVQELPVSHLSRDLVNCKLLRVGAISIISESLAPSTGPELNEQMM